MYRLILKPILFLLNPESAHNVASLFLRISSFPIINGLVRMLYSSPDSNYQCMGLNFPSRVGLAAGFDKNAEMYKGLGNLGFGFVEIGTVTPKAQPGNEKPRLFRLPYDNALINRMGFNNDGIQKVVTRLKSRNNNLIIGGNIGKNKVTPNDSAHLDYEICFEKLFDYVDYFTVNVSSPNTPGLRDLQDKEPLKKLLLSLQEKNKAHKKPKPILLKIAPDLTHNQLDEVVDIIIETDITGVIATNTTIDRSMLKTSKKQVNEIGLGGLSGEPLRKRALEVVSYLSNKSSGKFVIIGVGGISSAADAVNMINAGAQLVQVYTGFVYGGPGLIKEINRELN